ncbi:MAG: molybdopterin-dependent oxidoreductase [Actinomycetes bacterium]|jgi:hypothetical protein
MVTTRLLKVTIALIAVGGLSACSTNSGGTANPGQGASTPSPGATAPTANPYGSPPPVDPPGPNDSVMKVVGGTNGPQDYTLSQLEAVGTLQTVTIYEPFVKTQQTFKAIALKDLLEVAGIKDNQYIDTLALNNYTYDDLAGNLTGSDALIATQVNGAQIPIDQGGPVRLIFKDGTPDSTNLDAWNWSLKQISVIASPAPTPAAS